MRLALVVPLACACLVVASLLGSAQPVDSVVPSVASLQGRAVTRKCLAPYKKPDPKKRQAALAQYKKQQSLGLVGTPTVIDVYWHVVTCKGAGNLDRPTVVTQLEVLNIRYREKFNISFKFRLAGLDYRESCPFFTTGLETMADFSLKSRSRKGGKDALNVYSRELPGDVLGYSTSPEDIPFSRVALDDRRNKKLPYPGLKLDGVTIDWRTALGARVTFANYNLGITLVHEVGHWFGLAHIFEGGCANLDSIEDTPPQKMHQDNWPSNRVYNTCPGGRNDINGNYMDYSWDVQLDNFTPGQLESMHAMFNALRRPVTGFS